MSDTMFDRCKKPTGTIFLSLPESTAISYIRVFSLLLIVACHINQTFHTGWEWLLNIGVQIFLLVSGLLHGLKNIENVTGWYASKFKKVFVPYYAYLIIILPIYFIFSPNDITVNQALLYVLDLQMFIMGDSIDGLGHLWFMTAIAVCYIITPLLQRLKSQSNIISVGLFVVVLLYYIVFRQMTLYVSSLFMYMFGYYVINSCQSIRRYLGCGGLLIGFGIFLLPSVDFSVLLQSGGMPNRIFHDYVAIAFVILSMQFFTYLNVNKIIPVVKWLGIYSFPIYIVHGAYCLSSPFSIFGVIENPVAALPLFFLCVILSAMLLDRILNFRR